MNTSPREMTQGIISKHVIRPVPTRPGQLVLQRPIAIRLPKRKSDEEGNENSTPNKPKHSMKPKRSTRKSPKRSARKSPKRSARKMRK